jgi:hypothetical protein
MYSAGATKRLLVLSLLTGVIAIAFGLITIFVLQPQPNHLIDTHRYRLDTITGQVSFAKAVSKIQAYNPNAIFLSLIFISLALVVLILVSAYVFYKRIRRKIPGRIVANNLTLNEINQNQHAGSFEGVEAVRSKPGTEVD